MNNEVGLEWLVQQIHEMIERVVPPNHKYVS